MATQLWSILLMALSTVSSSFGSLYLKKGSEGIRYTVGSVAKNIPLGLGILLHGVAAVITLIAYSGGDLTVLVPIASLNYVWTALLAVKFLDEEMNIWKWAGITFVMAGIILISAGELLF